MSHITVLVLPLFLLIGALFFLIGVIYFLPSQAEREKAKAAREARRRENNRRIAEASWPVQVGSSANHVSGRLAKKLDN